VGFTSVRSMGERGRKHPWRSERRPPCRNSPWQLAQYFVVDGFEAFRLGGAEAAREDFLCARLVFERGLSMAFCGGLASTIGKKKNPGNGEIGAN